MGKSQIKSTNNIKKQKVRSYEEETEQKIKSYLENNKIEFFYKSDETNSQIDSALENYFSKGGGTGKNFPDIKMLLSLDTRHLPVMIEVKGARDKLAKFDEYDRIQMLNEKGNPHFSNIKQYALNGAVHYANAILKGSNYKECLAIGISGYKENDEILKIDYAVYYLSKKNLNFPKKVADYIDLSFLKGQYKKEFFKKLDELYLTDNDKEQITLNYEDKIDRILKNLNQSIYGNRNFQIQASERVRIIAGMIMAALGADNVAPLEVESLRSDNGSQLNDGVLIANKIKEFLEAKNIPKEKIATIFNFVETPLKNEFLYKAQNGISPLKDIYTIIKNQIVPIFKDTKHLDFTGRLFNVILRYEGFIIDKENDVVLTPRYVCEFMAKLCRVNKNSYVWDYAAGTGGFLISAMKLMIEDVESSENSPQERERKILEIKLNQILGIEILPEIYTLAVLNMILMGDGSTNLLNRSSLDKYSGIYEQGDNKNTPFPASVFLLNPPYSKPGKGLIFARDAFLKMKNNDKEKYGAVLIQDSAGSGNGNKKEKDSGQKDFAKDILKHSTLIASIKMPTDLFIGKSSVQTAIYLFKVGIPHNVENMVTFIDFSNDGYARQNRKKSGINLKNIDNATERYAEVIDIVLNRQKKTDFYSEENGLVVKATISLEGNDWNYNHHKPIDTTPRLEDFQKCVSEYLSFEVSQILKGQSEVANSPF